MSELPTGTVTFLFTDIEGSTRLWEQHPEAMQPALARHDAILREAIEANGGHVFKTVGDAFHAAFAAASDAVTAALTAQRQLLAHDWGQTGPVRVRVALHTGEAQAREDDYFGPALNRCARLLSAGHGGQILLSRPTADLARDGLPAGVDLRDLGECRLRDLTRPEHLFQLAHPDLPHELPPLRGLESFPNNLPLQTTSFVGREEEMADVERLLGETRLLTVTGVGGVGKTRLALQAGADVLDDFPDGAWLVELAALSDPALVPQALATALAVREHPDRALLHTLLDYLRSKRLLLLLDNCEHLVTACAKLADTVVSACPDVKILASSREGLGIPGETTYHVPSLSLPGPDEAVTVERIAACEAVGLFTDRAQSHQPAFAVTEANAEPVAQVCQRLDGIPLAIELAAARVRAMPVEQIAARLDDRFRLLTGGSRTALPRQQTLQALIDWSYDLLDEKERMLLRRLSVFAGGWTLEAAQAVCAGDGTEEWEVLDLLTGLVDKSVVVYKEEDAAARYEMLETIRQYARDRLLESGEGAAVRGRHRDYFFWLVTDRDARPEGLSEPGWWDHLEMEHDNLRAALDWCQDTDDAEAGLRLAAALGPFWNARGHLSEGRQRLDAALSCATEERTPTRAGALLAAGSVAGSQGDYSAARALCQEALTIWRELGHKHGIGDALDALGLVAWQEGDYSTARPLIEEALAIRRELGDKHGLALSLSKLGLIASSQGDHVAAQALLEESLGIHLERGNQRMVAIDLSNLGLANWRRGMHSRARRLLQESLATQREAQSKRMIVLCLERLACVWATEGRAAEGAHLFGAAEALREAIAAVFPRDERHEYDRSIAALRDALGEDAFAEAWAEGQAMTMEEAIAYALGEANEE